MYRPKQPKTQPHVETKPPHLVEVKGVHLVEVHVLVVDEQVELGRLVQHVLVEVEVEVEVEHDGQVVVLVQVRHFVLASSLAPDLALFSMPTIAFASCPCSSSSRPPSQA